MKKFLCLSLCLIQSVVLPMQETRLEPVFLSEIQQQQTQSFHMQETIVELPQSHGVLDKNPVNDVVREQQEQVVFEKFLNDMEVSRDEVPSARVAESACVSCCAIAQFCGVAIVGTTIVAVAIFGVVKVFMLVGEA